jgi:hypothetical protein
MKSGSKHIITAFFLLVSSFFAQSQVNVRSNIDRDNILIGEPLSLTVEAYAPVGAHVTWFNTDTIPHFETLKKDGVDTVQNIDAKKFSQHFELTSFDSGQQYIPPFEIVVDNQSYFTDSIAINVSFAPFNPNEDYRDIKDIIEVENPSVEYLQWLIAGLAVISLLVIALLWRRKRMAPAKKEQAIPALSAYEEAMKALAQMALKNINNGEVKAYYSEMNDILRKYVSRKFSVSTFERTNEELILELSGKGIPKDAFISLAQSLRMSDVVKFAKYRPSEDDNKNNLEIVTASIEILDKNFPGAV